MTKDKVTVIWFTGVISQYSVGNYSIENLKINHKILDKIMKEYKADKYVSIIWVANEEEKREYEKLIVEEDLQNKLLFVFLENYNNSYTPAGQVLALKYYFDINYYIDCSRTRLCKVRDGIEDNKLIHISQLLE